MSLNISLELYFICKAILSGVFLRFVYDLLRISRRVLRRNVIIVAVEDTIYWIMAGLAVFIIMYEFNGGKMRFHAFILVALGMLLYGISLSPIIVKYVSLILLKIKFIIVKLLKKLGKKVKIIKKSKVKKKRKGAKKDEQKGSSKKKKIK